MPGDDDCRIRRTLAYVPSVARRYLGNGLDYHELIAAGNLGLVQASLRFDPSYKVRFVTYADWWIRKAIIEALEEQNGPVRVPRYQYEKQRTVEQARVGWVARFGQEPTVDQLSLASGLTPREVERVPPIRRSSVSLDQPVGPNGERPLGEVLPDPRAESPQTSLVRRELAAHLRRHLEELEPREREVISHRFGLDGDHPRTLRHVGRLMGISRERVRQLELRALLKLRERF